jgi:hypothetical protein
VTDPRDPDAELSRDDQLLTASLHGRSGYHVNDHTPHDEAVADLRALATVTPKPRRGHPTPKPVLRVDLLSIVAGQHIGAHRADAVKGWIGPPATRLLADAGGTDRD